MRRLWIAILLLILLQGTALAVDEQALIDRQADALGAGELGRAVPDGARPLLDGVSLQIGTDITGGMSGIWENVVGSLGGVLREAARSAATVMVIAILVGLLRSIYEGSGAEVPDFVSLLGVLAVSAAALGSSRAFIGLGADTLQELEAFSKVLFPTLAAAGTASGAFTSATVKYAGTVLFLDVLMTVSGRVILPVIYAYMAAAIGNAAMGSSGLKGAVRLLKWVAGALITVIMIAFVTYITVIGLVSASADVVATRLAKTAISTALPVVGGIIADAGGTVVAGAALVRNAMGVMGLLVVLAICLLPILQLGAHYLLFKAAAAVSASVTDPKIGELIGDLGTAFGMMVGLVGAGAMMIFFSILSMMRMVTG
ncbi:MAG: stage III sporulation protein AE [Oscillospiraceae bacterium]|nr:stage III sporulation protein AE [Oscillospiraceae bacterium]